MNWLIELLFKCNHRKTNHSRPFTHRGFTYKVCMECGTRMPYSLKLGRLLTAKEWLREQYIKIVSESLDRQAIAITPEKLLYLEQLPLRQLSRIAKQHADLLEQRVVEEMRDAGMAANSAAVA